MSLFFIQGFLKPHLKKNQPHLTCQFPSKSQFDLSPSYITSEKWFNAPSISERELQTIKRAESPTQILEALGGSELSLKHLQLNENMAVVLNKVCNSRQKIHFLKQARERMSQIIFYTVRACLHRRCENI